MFSIQNIDTSFEKSMFSQLFCKVCFRSFQLFRVNTLFFVNALLMVEGHTIFIQICVFWRKNLVKKVLRFIPSVNFQLYKMLSMSTHFPSIHKVLTAMLAVYEESSLPFRLQRRVTRQRQVKFLVASIALRSPLYLFLFLLDSTATPACV